MINAERIFYASLVGMKDEIAEDTGHLCGGIAVQGMRLQSMNCAERGNGFVCEMPGRILQFIFFFRCYFLKISILNVIYF